MLYPFFWLYYYDSVDAFLLAYNKRLDPSVFCADVFTRCNPVGVVAHSYAEAIQCAF